MDLHPLSSRICPRTGICFLPGAPGMSGQWTTMECLWQSFRQLLKKGWICESREEQGRAGKRGTPRYWGTRSPHCCFPASRVTELAGCSRVSTWLLGRPPITERGSKEPRPGAAGLAKAGLVSHQAGSPHCCWVLGGSAGASATLPPPLAHLAETSTCARSLTPVYTTLTHLYLVAAAPLRVR